MCGIAAYSGSKEFNPGLMKTLMLSNLIRGQDSTGIYSPKNGLIKNIGNAVSFLSKHREIKKDKVFIGHLRAKTVGENLEKNAHPFELDNLVGVHNGTLIDYWGLARKYDLLTTGISVDSHMLYGILSQEIGQYQNAVTKLSVLSQFEGAAALVYYNKLDQNLYVYRNKERPLHYGYVNEMMYIASLEESLEIIGATEITQFTENELYKIKDGIIQSKTYYLPKSKEVTPPYVYGRRLPALHAHEYVGNYFMADVDKVDSFIYKNRFYYVISTVATKYDPKKADVNYVVLVNEFGDRVEYSKHNLDMTSYQEIRKPKTYVLVTDDLFIDHIKVVSKDEMLETVLANTDRNENGTVNILCYSFKSKINYTISSKFIRALDDEEIEENCINNDYYNNDTLKKYYGNTAVLAVEENLVEAPCCEVKPPVLTIVRTLIGEQANIKEDEFYNFLDSLDMQVDLVKNKVIDMFINAEKIEPEEEFIMNELVDECFVDMQDMVKRTYLALQKNGNECEIIY